MVRTTYRITTAALVVALLLSYISFAQSAYAIVLPVGAITSPDVDEVVSGAVALTATYDDSDMLNDDLVNWAVRPYSAGCNAGANLFGGGPLVPGVVNTSLFIFDGKDFVASVDTTSVPDGAYCFAYNPTDDAGEPDVRVVRRFVIDNANADFDIDGVINSADYCPNTEADTFESFGRAKGRYMLNSDFDWKSAGKGDKNFKPTIEQTKGCSGEQILAIVKEKTGLDFEGHDKFGLSKSLLEAWMAGTYHVGLTYVETVTVEANDADGANSSDLKDGVDYLLSATSVADAGDTIQFDAQYSFRELSSSEWTDTVSTYEGYGAKLLDLLVDGADVDWGAYNAAHEYKHIVTGTGAPVNLTIYDVYYPNNVGSLVVDIYEDLWVDLW